MKLTDVIRRAADHREDDAPARGRPDVVFEVAAGRHQGRHQARGREAARLEGRGGPHVAIAHGKIKRQGRFIGQRLGLEEGLRQAARGEKVREGEKIPSSWKL